MAIDVTGTILQYLRTRADALTEQGHSNYRGDPNALSCKIPSKQADILRDVAKEIEQGAHFESAPETA